MSEELKEHLSNYIQNRIDILKKYLLAAYDNKDQCIWYLESSEGMSVPSSDLKNCQFLKDAQLFNEDVRMSRHGRNVYKIYCLTELGKNIAERIKREGLAGSEVEAQESK